MFFSEICPRTETGSHREPVVFGSRFENLLLLALIYIANRYILMFSVLLPLLLSACAEEARVESFPMLGVTTNEATSLQLPHE